MTKLPVQATGHVSTLRRMRGLVLKLNAWAYTIQNDCVSRKKRLPANFTRHSRQCVCTLLLSPPP